MKKLYIVLFLVMASIVSAKDVAYLRVPGEEANVIVGRLDTLITKTPTTQHYSLPMYPFFATATTDVVFIVEDEERVRVALADNVLWNQRLATMPVEFVPPMPDEKR